MAKQISFGVDGVARTVSTPYIGVNGVARTVSEGDIGVDGVARRFHGVSKIYKETKTVIGTNNYSIKAEYVHYTKTDESYVFDEETGLFSLEGASYKKASTTSGRVYLESSCIIANGDNSVMYSFDIGSNCEYSARVGFSQGALIQRQDTAYTLPIYKHTAEKI